MGFNAADAVPALDWDFSKYKGGKGCAPEPSDQMIEKFRRTYTRIVESISAEFANRIAEHKLKMKDGQETEEEETGPPTDQFLGEPLTVERGLATLDAWIIYSDEEEGPRFAQAQMLSRKMREACAEVLSNTPSAEAIDKLPQRLQKAFFAWVVGQLLDPKSGIDVLN